MLQSSVKTASQVLCGEARGSSVVLFWLRLLTAIPSWTKDRNVLYLVDRLIQAAYTLHGVWDTVIQFFCKLYKVSNLQNPVINFV